MGMTEFFAMGGYAAFVWPANVNAPDYNLAC